MPPHQQQGQARRTAILTFLRAYITRHGFAPAMSEIGAAVGLSSSNSTRNHLLWLQDDGFILVTPGIARAIRLVEPAPDGWTAAEAQAS